MNFNKHLDASVKMKRKVDGSLSVLFVYCQDAILQLGAPQTFSPLQLLHFSGVTTVWKLTQRLGNCFPPYALLDTTVFVKLCSPHVWTRGLPSKMPGELKGGSVALLKEPQWGKWGLRQMWVVHLPTKVFVVTIRGFEAVTSWSQALLLSPLCQCPSNICIL